MKASEVGKYKKSFEVIGSFPRAEIEPFVFDEDERLLGRSLELHNLEGTLKLYVRGNTVDVRAPVQAPMLRHDPHYIQGGTVFRAVLHLQTNPGTVVENVELVDELGFTGIMMLGWSVTEEGLIALTLWTPFRVEWAANFPVAYITVSEFGKPRPKPKEKPKIEEPAPIVEDSDPEGIDDPVGEGDGARPDDHDPGADVLDIEEQDDIPDEEYDDIPEIEDGESEGENDKEVDDGATGKAEDDAGVEVETGPEGDEHGAEQGGK